MTTLKEKRGAAKAVLAEHPGHVRTALERAFPGAKILTNLAKDLAWLRGVARGLDVVMLEHLVSSGLVANLEGRRYGITTAGLKFLGRR